jgi:predicted heme/steroid binding protein
MLEEARPGSGEGYLVTPGRVTAVSGRQAWQEGRGLHAGGVTLAGATGVQTCSAAAGAMQTVLGSHVFMCQAYLRLHGQVSGRQTASTPEASV